MDIQEWDTKNPIERTLYLHGTPDSRNAYLQMKARLEEAVGLLTEIDKRVPGLQFDFESDAGMSIGHRISAFLSAQREESGK
jgi:hypothetical protein